MWRVLLLFGAIGCASADHFIRGSAGSTGSKYFIDKNGGRIFLSGANMAWVNFCRDFGNNGFDPNTATFETVLKQMRNHGANSLRIWIHCHGQATPHFNHSGFVDKMQTTGNLAVDMQKLLDIANRNKILVFFVLWSGAGPASKAMAGLVTSPNGGPHDKLASYLSQLTTLVRLLKYHPALGGWEIMNEIQGLFTPNRKDSGCHDTTGMRGGWAINVDHHRPWEYLHTFTLRQLQTFVSRQAAAIHAEDPLAQITCSSDVYSSTNGHWGRNVFADDCLKSVGGGRLTFYEIHTYAHNKEYDAHSPIMTAASHYALDKPLVVGEFSHVCSHNRSASTLFTHVYNQGFAGGWSWQWFPGPGHDDVTSGCRGRWDDQLTGMSAIAGKTSHGYVRVPENMQF